MSVEAIKETLCINQIIGQRIDTAIIEEDFVVPDIKPDIINTISTNGTVCINAYVIYLADDEQSQIRSINTNLDFSQTIDFKDLKEGMTAKSNISIKSIECRVLNGRKVNVRAILDIDLKAYSNEELEFMREVEGIKDIQLLNESFNINSLLGIGNTKIYAKDTVVIDNIDEIAEIMKVNVDIQNKETKISYNKVLIKADQVIKIMYLSTDNRICTKLASIPIMGFIDMQDVNDENICEVEYEIRNILIKPNSAEEHSVYVEIENDVTCSTYQNKNLRIIQDLYSPTINLAYKQKMIKTMSGKSVIKDVCPIREKQVIPEIGNNKIYDVDIKPYILSQNIINDRIVYEGEIELKFIFGEEAVSKIDSKTIIVPFEYNMNSPGISNNFKIDTKLEVTMQDFVIMPDQSIDIKIDLQFVANSFKNEELNVIQEINIEENRDNEKYSIIIYFTKSRRHFMENSKKV